MKKRKPLPMLMAWLAPSHMGSGRETSSWRGAVSVLIILQNAWACKEQSSSGKSRRLRQKIRRRCCGETGMADTVAQWNQISFMYEGQLSLQDIRRRVELHRPQVVFIDHIGLMKRPQAANAYRELGLLSNQLKHLALEEKICVVALSQMNRQVENRAGKELNLSDLRESGDLEQDSDFIGFLQPQVVKGRRLTGADSMDSFLVVKKAREGQMEGRVLYHWQPQYHRFVEVEERYGA